MVHESWVVDERSARRIICGVGLSLEDIHGRGVQNLRGGRLILGNLRKELSSLVIRTSF